MGEKGRRKIVICLIEKLDSKLLLISCIILNFLTFNLSISNILMISAVSFVAEQHF